MNSMERYLVRVSSLIVSLSHLLANEERAQMAHLIEHGEPAEAVRTLAWLLAEKERLVPRAVIESIRELTSGLIDDSDLPPNLDQLAEK